MLRSYPQQLVTSTTEEPFRRLVRVDEAIPIGIVDEDRVRRLFDQQAEAFLAHPKIFLHSLALGDIECHADDCGPSLVGGERAMGQDVRRSTALSLDREREQFGFLSSGHQRPQSLRDRGLLGIDHEVEERPADHLGRAVAEHIGEARIDVDERSVVADDVDSRDLLFHKGAELRIALLNSASILELIAFRHVGAHNSPCRSDANMSLNAEEPLACVKRRIRGADDK